MKRTSLILSLAIVAGCAAQGHLNTPSGHPEVTVRASVQDAQKASLQWLLANGFTVGNPPANAQVIELSGHQYFDNGSTNMWITFNYFPKDSTTTTIYASKVNWFRPSGNRPQTTQEDYEELQGDLNTIAQNLTAPK